MMTWNARLIFYGFMSSRKPNTDMSHKYIFVQDMTLCIVLYHYMNTSHIFQFSLLFV